MTPAEFMAEVAQPNMEVSLKNPDDLRAAVNAVFTLDAVPGHLHAVGVAAGDAAMTKHKTDDKYRDELAGISPAYRVLRDTAAALKHGTLTNAKARLVRNGGAFQSVNNGLGLFQLGDRFGGSIMIIEFDPGPGYVRASDVIADSYRMLQRIVDGEPARTDDRDRPISLGTREGTAPSVVP